MCSAEQRRPPAPTLLWPCGGGRLHGAKEAQQPAPRALAAGWGPLDLTAERGPRVVSVASQLCRGKGKATPGEHHTCTWTNLGSLRSWLLSAQTTRCRGGHWGEITALWGALSVRISSFSIVTGMQETFRDQLSFFFFLFLQATFPLLLRCSILCTRIREPTWSWAGFHLSSVSSLITTHRPNVLSRLIIFIWLVGFFKSPALPLSPSLIITNS